MSEVLTSGRAPLIYVIDTCEYRSSLGKLIRKLRIFSLSIALVPFLSSKKLESSWASFPAHLSQNRSIKIMRKPLSQKNKNSNFVLITHLRRAEIKTWIN